MNHQNAPPFPLMSRNACTGENGKNGEKSPASDNSLAWRLAILAKFAILAKIDRGLAIIVENVPAP